MKTYTKQLEKNVELRYHYSRKEKGWVMEIYIGDKCIKSSIQQTLMKDYYINETAERDLRNYRWELERQAWQKKAHDTDLDPWMKRYVAVYDTETKNYRIMEYNGKGQYRYLDSPDTAWFVSSMKKVPHRFVSGETMNEVKAAIAHKVREDELAAFHRVHPINNPNAKVHCPSCNHPLNVDPFEYEPTVYYEGDKGDEIVGLKSHIQIKCKCGHCVNICPEISYDVC